MLAAKDNERWLGRHGSRLCLHLMRVVNKQVIQSGISLSLPYHSPGLMTCISSVTTLIPAVMLCSLTIYSKYNIAPLILQIILCIVQVYLTINRNKWGNDPVFEFFSLPSGAVSDNLLVLCIYPPTDGTNENLDQKHEASLY